MVPGIIRPLLAQRGQGGRSSAPKARWVSNHKWAHLSQFWPRKWPKHIRTPKLAIVQSMASGNHQGPPAQLQARIPLKFRGRIFLPQFPPHSRIQEWCIYGIIYQYAPFLLSNPMVTLTEPNYVIPNQVPNPSPISKEVLSAIQSGNSLAPTRKQLEDPNHLALQELGCQF
ncbi:hypothetical protein O181_042908 [Austropuccinia psidii MF-1]|uniref:Uncharacterized protein n=1 Tax=Austropuccinia psidii MF-1 TaxID=1389203 RepID=A0A9Q3DKA0_9BASI|nr:hypothetical protein [Austropuccinia psidii MF-1]